MFGLRGRLYSAVFIGRSFMLVFNLSPRLRGASAVAAAAYCKLVYTNFALVLYHLRQVANPNVRGGERWPAHVVSKLPGTFDNLSVCMFYRFRQVQTELSDVELGGELNRPVKPPW